MGLEAADLLSFFRGEWWKDDNAPYFLIAVIFTFLQIMYPLSRNHHLCFGTSPGTQFKSMHTNYASICQFTIHIVAYWESDDTRCGCCCRRIERGGLAPKCFMVRNEGHTIAQIRAWHQSLQPVPARVYLQPGTYSSFKPRQSPLQKLWKPRLKDGWIFA